MALFHGSTPQDFHRKLMVQKLANAAAKTSAKNVILREELRRMREKAAHVSDFAKIKSRKVLTKAPVVSVEVFLKLREEQEKKEREAAAKKARAAERKKAKEEGRKLPRAPRKRKNDLPVLEVIEGIPVLDLEVDGGIEGGEELSEWGSGEEESSLDDYPNHEEELSPYIDRTRTALQALSMGESSSFSRMK